MLPDILIQVHITSPKTLTNKQTSERRLLEFEVVDDLQQKRVQPWVREPEGSLCHCQSMLRHLLPAKSLLYVFQMQIYEQTTSTAELLSSLVAIRSSPLQREMEWD